MKNTATISHRYPLRPCTIIYILLVTMTLVTWQICRMEMSGIEIALLVLLFALIKGVLIGDYYMALRGIRSLWRCIRTGRPAIARISGSWIAR